MSTCSHVWSPPSFRSLGQDLHLYSAFCRGSGEEDDVADSCSAVAATALALKASDMSSSLGCKLWLEGEDHAAEGSVRVADIPKREGDGVEEESYRAVSLICQAKNGLKSPPFSVSYFKLEDREEEVHLGVERPYPPIDALESAEQKESSSKLSGFVLSPRPDSFGACVLPQQSGDSADATFPAAETVLLSSYFGVKHFLLYDGGGLPSERLLHRILARARGGPDPSLDVLVAPWDPPARAARSSPAASEALARADCFLRAHGWGWETAAALRAGQVLAPGGGFETVQSALRSTRRRTRHLSFEVIRFCAEFDASEEAAR